MENLKIKLILDTKKDKLDTNKKLQDGSLFLKND